ncbi:MAG: tetratricopeptide repeat protein [Deltaproteobacteria bacterium]|nr:tetratricopeptide repeat protein [Deltaproteobacteria bacterium]
MPPRPSPLLKAGDAPLQKRGQDKLAEDPEGAALRWGKGEATLQEVKGYSDEELYHIAQHGYTLFLNGKVSDAQTVFEGLVAIDPRNEYYYRALGVVYHRRGAVDRAIRQFDAALQLNPGSLHALVNRAEVHISRRDFSVALDDLGRAVRLAGDSEEPIARKARALTSLIRKKHG